MNANEIDYKNNNRIICIITTHSPRSHFSVKSAVGIVKNLVIQSQTHVSFLISTQGSAIYSQ
jgi:hypothetical protein